MVVIDQAGHYLYEAAPGYIPEPDTREVDTPSPRGFFVPVWDGTQWTEGESAAQRQQRLATLAAAEIAGARAWRDSELLATDWTQVNDAPVDRATWAAYRQALRDWPQSPTFPATKPARPS